MDQTLLTLLRRVDTPTVLNAIEVVQGKRGFKGFTRGTMVASAPQAPAMVGYAVTAQIAGLAPPTEPVPVIRARRMAYYKAMFDAPKPSIAVIEDVDYPHCVAAYWGEVNTTVHKSFGMSGALTNGVVRDLGDLPEGFPVLAGSIGPSHGFAHGSGGWTSDVPVVGPGGAQSVPVDNPFALVLTAVGLLGLASVMAAVALVAGGAVRMQFFAFDPIRAFYVNVDMPQTASLEDTLTETQRVEAVVREQLRGVGLEGEARAVTSTAGLKFTETEPVYGDLYGQVFVSLNPRTDDSREVMTVIEDMRKTIENLPGPGRKSFTALAGGPPAGKAISVKVRGDEFQPIQRAADALKTIVAAIPGAKDVQDDNQPGRAQLQLQLDPDAVRDAGLNAALVARLVRLSVDGEVVAFTRDGGDKIELRVRSDQALRGQGDLRVDPASLLDEPIALPNGQTTRLGALVQAEAAPGRGFIRHYNLRRTTTVEANLDKDITDTKVANDLIKAGWETIRAQHPGVDLDFSGELEDIEESLDSMQVLFLLGVGLIYLILAAQFKSYWQPLMILVTVPLAFTGVAFGLAISNNPLSLYTLYGVIALTGIAVNSAIVLIDAANDRMQRGMSTIHAIIQASRRRVVPILITTTTTIGGLFSLAFGLGGQSLLWGPVAASIVWGLAFSTVLTLFVVPLLYLGFMRPKAARATRRWWHWRRPATA